MGVKGGRYRGCAGVACAGRGTQTGHRWLHSMFAVGCTRSMVALLLGAQCPYRPLHNVVDWDHDRCGHWHLDTRQSRQRVHACQEHTPLAAGQHAEHSTVSASMRVCATRGLSGQSAGVQCTVVCATRQQQQQQQECRLHALRRASPQYGRPASPP